MTKREARTILARAFRALPKRDLDRLVWHAEQKTPICCGTHAVLFTDGEGGG